jgi:hypothetical protein
MQSNVRGITDSGSSLYLERKVQIAVGLPDPSDFWVDILNSNGKAHSSTRLNGVKCFVGREPAYVAFVFDKSPCEVHAVMPFIIQ